MNKSCCLSGFTWDGQPSGHETTLASLPTYKTGTNPRAAILVIADLFGWTFPNLRLLCDHYAQEADATVYLPDLYDYRTISLSIVMQDRANLQSQFRRRDPRRRHAR